MNKSLVTRLLPHFIAVVVFLIVAVIYCKPTLEGKVLQQTDVVQWKAMAQNSFDYKAKHGHFPLWTNGMFSGMPAYQIAMEPEVVISPIWVHGLATLWLPKPISFFFLACICFYFLSQVLRINPYIGIIGGLAYAYATYNPVIVAVGHDTKMFTIAYLPAFIGSLILLFEKRYLWGAALTALFTSLLIAFNHMQIVYYSLIIAVFMTIGYAIYYIKRGEIRHILIAGAIAVAAGLIGVLSNAVQIMTTLESSKTTIRGGTELPNPNETASGLSKDYALSYSLYKPEPFVMMVPKMYGGSSLAEVSEEDSKAIKTLQESVPGLTQALSTQMDPQSAQGAAQQILTQFQYSLSYYWGGIGGTSGPPYVGAIICFLALIGFFLLDNKYKWWILACTVLTIVMSWGEYFLGFNTFLLNNLPMYNKFRAPSMILVIPTFLFCMMAVLTLQKVISTPDKEVLWQRYKKGLLLTGGVFVVLLLIYFSVDFAADRDKSLLQWAGSLPDQFKTLTSNYATQFLSALKEDRKDLFFGSLVRSFLFVAAAAAVLWLMIRKNFGAMIGIAIIGIMAFGDVISIDTKYLNSENFKDKEEYEANFTPVAADSKILQDTSNYRVLDLREGVHNAFNGGRLTMYFHKSIGGYHPAKLSIYQDLIEHQLYKLNDQMLVINPGYSPVVNMLNTRYFILPTQAGDTVVANPSSLGAAWFVKGIRYEKNASAVMNALSNFNSRDTAILFEADRSGYVTASDSASSIALISNDNDVVTYRSTSTTGGFAVFSEVFYKQGWKAFVDEKEVPIIRTNYVLRGVQIPAGQHAVKFVFHPSSFYSGEKMATVGGILVLLMLLGAIFMEYRKKRTANT